MNRQLKYLFRNKNKAAGCRRADTSAPMLSNIPNLNIENNEC
jgi:hypothetical protein